MNETFVSDFARCSKERDVMVVVWFTTEIGDQEWASARSESVMAFSLPPFRTLRTRGREEERRCGRRFERRRKRE